MRRPQVTSSARRSRDGGARARGIIDGILGDGMANGADTIQSGRVATRSSLSKLAGKYNEVGISLLGSRIGLIDAKTRPRTCHEAPTTPQLANLEDMANRKFNVAELIQRMGEQLTQEFETAGLGTTGTIQGDAREKAIRDKLQEVLSGNNTVTEGVVIDSYGDASQQTDIVLHESDHCPVFNIGGPEGESYIPCEGVWAAGEVKSRLRRDDLRSICEHSLSVKKLKRYAKRERDLLGEGETVSFRSYGSGMALSGTAEESYDQDNKETDRIFTFGIVGRWELSPASCNVELSKFIADNGREMAPNIIIGIDRGILLPVLRNDEGYGPGTDWTRADAVASSMAMGDRWRKLVATLNYIRTRHRTVEVRAFNRYTTLSGGLRLLSSGIDEVEVGARDFEVLDL